MKDRQRLLRRCSSTLDNRCAVALRKVVRGWKVDERAWRRRDSEDSRARQFCLGEDGGAEKRGVRGLDQLAGSQEDANRDQQARWDT
jgi:hypothetical protein